MNKIIVSGNLGADAKFVKSEKSNFISFQVATGGDDPDWIDCSMNVKGDEDPKVLTHLKKGKKVLLTGKPYAKLMTGGEEPTAKQCMFVNNLELL